MILRTVSYTGAEPVTLADAKQNSRILSSVEDTFLESKIAEARAFVETLTNRFLARRVVDLFFDGFPGALAWPLRVEPLISVDSITYLDADGASVVMDAADYTVDTATIGGRVRHRSAWPATYDDLNAVVIRCTVGPLPVDVEPDLRGAILRVVDDLFMTRGNATDVKFSDAPLALRAVTAPYRVEYV